MVARGHPPEAASALDARLGYSFRDEALRATALTHASWSNEAVADRREDNERLEFLGDAVLALVVSDLLMRRLPDRSEGELTRVRATLVSESGLTRAAAAIDLGSWIFLGRGEERSGGRARPSILANALEAVMGAVYLDGGLPAAAAVAERLFADLLRDAEQLVGFDQKSRLQERAQARGQQPPVYEVVAEHGPDHDKRFEIVLSIGGREYGRAVGRSKKEAEQAAAAAALAAFEPESAR